MNILDKYAPKSILKVFSYTAVATLVKMLAGFISLKIIAKMVGPEGVVMLGQLSNFSTVILVIATGGIGNGITKYISEYKGDTQKTDAYISNALQITLLFCLACAVSLIFFSRFLSRRIFLNDEYQYIFILFAATIFFYALNNLVSAVINGFQDYKKYVLINLSNSLMSLLFTIILVVIWRMKGVLVSAVTYQSVVFLCTVFIIYKQPWIKNIRISFKIDQLVWKQFLRYSLMMFTTAATIPVAQLAIRSMLLNELSIKQAGLWEGMNRISGAYLAVFVTSFSVYYLPRLSEIQNTRILRTEVFTAYRIILPVVIFLFTLIYLFRASIISVLFTSDFQAMESLFLLQLVGDFLKISGWLIGFVMIAKSHAKFYILTDVLFSIGYVALSYIFLDQFALPGIMISYVVMYFIYVIAMMLFFNKFTQN